MERPLPDGFIEITYTDGELRTIEYLQLDHYSVKDGCLFLASGHLGTSRCSMLEYIPLTSIRQLKSFPNSDTYMKATEAFQEQCIHDWEGVPSNHPMQPDFRECKLCDLSEPIAPPDMSERTEM